MAATIDTVSMFLVMPRIAQQAANTLPVNVTIDGQVWDTRPVADVFEKYVYPALHCAFEDDPSARSRLPRHLSTSISSSRTDSGEIRFASMNNVI